MSITDGDVDKDLDELFFKYSGMLSFFLRNNCFQKHMLQIQFFNHEHAHVFRVANHRQKTERPNSKH